MEKKLKVYIAGPVRGVIGYREKFEDAEWMLRGKGCEPVNPTKIPLGESFDDEQFMVICRELVPMCDAIFLLDGWENSSGAKEELRVYLDNHRMCGYTRGKAIVMLQTEFKNGKEYDFSPLPEPEHEPVREVYPF